MAHNELKEKQQQQQQQHQSGKQTLRVFHICFGI